MRTNFFGPRCLVVFNLYAATVIELSDPSWNLLQGGILWFKNLTELPHGMLGSIFPIVVAGLHYTNVQVDSFPTIEALIQVAWFYAFLLSLSL